MISWLRYLIEFWIPFGVPALLGCVPLWFLGRRRVEWFRWEFAACLTVPYLLWYTLVAIECRGKSFANVGLETFAIGCSVVAVPLVRVLVGRRADPRWVAGSLLGVVCLVAVALWALVPALPE